jgi:hypothetical protein
MTPPRLLAVAPPGWHADLRAFRRQLMHFTEATADLGAGAAVYLRAHDQTLAQWHAWLTGLQVSTLGALRVGVSAPLGDGVLDIAASHNLLVEQGIRFVHLPATTAKARWLLLHQDVDFRLEMSCPCHDPQDLGDVAYAWRLLSPVLPTPSKPGQPSLGLERLTEAVQQSRTPLLALGGVDALTAPAVLATGVAGIACLRAAWHDAEALVRACVADPRGSS